MRKTTSSGARPKCAQSAIPSPGSLETSPTELHDHTSRYTTTGLLPCKVNVELRRLTHRVYHRRPSIALYAGTCGCHDNLREPVAPRRQGPWVPSPSRTGVFGPPSPCCITHAGSRVPHFGDKWQLGRALFGLPAREL